MKSETSLAVIMAAILIMVCSSAEGKTPVSYSLSSSTNYGPGGELSSLSFKFEVSTDSVGGACPTPSDSKPYAASLDSYLAAAAPELIGAEAFNETDAQSLASVASTSEAASWTEAIEKAEAVIVVTSDDGKKCFDQKIWRFRIIGCAGLHPLGASLVVKVDVPILGWKTMGRCNLSIGSGPGCTLGYRPYASVRVYIQGMALKLEASIAGISKSFTIIGL